MPQREADIEDYARTLERMHQLFRTCPDPNKMEHEGGWSVKEVLGHLVDSLSNNHQRLMRYRAGGRLEFPGYDQEQFVRRANYRGFEFDVLLSLWYSYNRLFLHIIASIPADDIGSTIAVGDRPTVTLGQLIQDYFRHMDLHRKQVERIIRASWQR